MIPILVKSFNYSNEDCLMLSKKKRTEHKAKSEDDSDEEPHTYLTYVNNLLHSLFSNCEVYFNKTMVCNAHGLYPHKA